MKKIKELLLALLIILMFIPLYSSSFAEDNISNSKASFCEQEFDYFSNELNKLSKKDPIFSNFETEAYIDKSYVEQEGGMYYGLHLSKNYRPSKTGNNVINKAMPYIYINFSLRTGHYSGQADILSLEHYYSHKEITPTIQHSSRSGITIFGQVNGYNKNLEEKIHIIFEKIIDDILEWEKEKITNQ